ncbi:MAG TPA: PEP-CTERM sorting domain-containing protein [Burkholderiales bacterium]|nr:PEP-CTERM sorting domain-containing protein [Burkholderiales bacterium]
MIRLRMIVSGVFLAIAPLAAAGGTPGPSVPEPETLALIGIGVVALIIAKTRKRK